MAATLDECAYLADYPTFRGRVKAAMVKAAVAVGAENNDGSETARLRRAHAVNVLNNPDGFAPQYAWAVATNPVITMASIDGDIEYTVNSSWNAMAGAGPNSP